LKAGQKKPLLKYDMVVIGAGAAGLVTGAASSIYGAKTCLIERNLMGGDCLVTGCVPSKAFLKSCHVAHTCKNAEAYGVEIEGTVKINFPKLMARMREIRAEISKADSANKFSKYYGLDIFLGNAAFTARNRLVVNGQEIEFFRATIATGARPLVPDYQGIKDIHYYTSDNIFNLVEQPKKMLIIGSGPIGSELGQGFSRLGTQVVMFERTNKFLPRDDQSVVHLLKSQMQADGVEIRNHTTVVKFEKDEGSKVKVFYKMAQIEGVQEEVFDVLMFATGRVPNVENMGLDKAGVKFDKRGITVDDNLKTSNSNIYSCGDCVPGAKFTHNSDIQARIVFLNALFYGS